MTSTSILARRALFIASGTVTLLGLLVETLPVASGWRFEGWVPLFSLSYEQNVPTWYSSAVLLCCALALARISLLPAATQRLHWRILSGGFLFISLDEIVGLHERLGPLLPLNGVLYFSWVVPAATVVAVLAVFFYPFLQRLPADKRKAFVIAGAVYVTGALLMELPLGYWTEQHGDDNLVYALIDFVEESLEILGTSLFLSALLDWGHDAG